MSAPQKRNTSPEFAGIDRLKAAQRQQLAQFEAWADAGQWGKFHAAHYDWWMFPISAPSNFGLQWTVYAGDISELKADEAYQRDYLRGVALLMASWGWDLEAQNFLPHPSSDQQWQNWPVRLYKAAVSVQSFGFDQPLTSLKKYALLLIERGASMKYNGRDLAIFFTEGKDPYGKNENSHGL